MEIELAPAVTPPMVSPDNTTVTAVLAAMAVAPVSVMTIWLAVGVALVPVDAPVVPAVKLTVGTSEVAKKLSGEVSVRVLREAAALIAPPNDVVNVNVAALEVLAATRSVNAMLNVGLVTLSPIAPDATVDGLALASAEV